MEGQPRELSAEELETQQLVNRWVKALHLHLYKVGHLMGMAIQTGGHSSDELRQCIALCQQMEGICWGISDILEGNKDTQDYQWLIPHDGPPGGSLLTLW